MKQDPPFIPNKYKVKPYPGQSDSQKHRNVKLETLQVELEIERLEEEFIKNESILDSCEVEIKSLISQMDDPIERQRFTEKWITNVKSEEENSELIWSKKKESFDKMVNNNSHSQEKTSNGHNKKQPRNDNYNRGKRKDNTSKENQLLKLMSDLLG